MGLIPAWNCSQNQSRNSLCGWRGLQTEKLGSERSRDWLEAVHQFGARWDKGQEHSTLLLWEKKFNWHISMCSGHHPLLSQRANVTDVGYRGWSTHEWMEDGQESHRLPQIEKDVLLVSFYFWDTGNNTEFLTYPEWAEFPAGADNQMTHIASHC